jgi:hypothetical protein
MQYKWTDNVLKKSKDCCIVNSTGAFIGSKDVVNSGLRKHTIFGYLHLDFADRAYNFIRQVFRFV